MEKHTSDKIVRHRATVTRERREQQGKHRSALLWFTGLSGSGKSTLAHAVEERLHQLGYKTLVLDGDNVRHGLCKDLGFSDEDRNENLRRIGEVSKLFIETGIITLAAYISPFKDARKKLREMFAPEDFFEIYCNCPLEICESRDVKGMYKRARAGEILNFTGISAPYEEPENPEILINTGSQTLEESIEIVTDFLAKVGVFHGRLSN
ncbi:MAG: adenylyl-sulfate kinase [Nitrospinota bacterium]